MKSFFALCLLFPGVLFPQQIVVTITGLYAGEAYISTITGEKISPIDSINSLGMGRFRFSLHPQYNHPGFYRLSFDKNRWIDFLNDGKEIAITTDANVLRTALTGFATITL